MRILIENLKVSCIIGILPDERLTPQEIDLTIDVGLSTSDKKTITIDDTVDYAELAQLCENILQEERFLLLENAVLVLTQRISARWPMIGDCTLHLRKPKALKQGMASVKLSRAFRTLSENPKVKARGGRKPRFTRG